MTTVVVAYPWNADDALLAPLRAQFVMVTTAKTDRA